MRILDCEFRAHTESRHRQPLIVEIRNPQFEFRNSLCALRFFLRAHLFRDYRQIARHSLQHSNQTLRLAINQEQDLGNQFLARRQARYRFDFPEFDYLAFDQANFKAEDVRVRLAEFSDSFRQAHGIAGTERHRGHAFELIAHRLERRTGRGLPRQSVLHHGIRDTSLMQLSPQFLVLGDGHFVKAHQHRRVSVLELLSEGVEVFLFLFAVFHSQLLTYLANAASSSSTPGLMVQAILTFFIYLPLAVEGFALTTASINARVFSAILFSSNETLPTAV